jgi:hypothetical protein
MSNETSGWIELAKALPSIVTAITAVVGVSIARAGLDKWRIETVGKRKAELAEQALTAAYEVRDVFVWVRSRGIFGGEGSSRKPAENESKTQQEKRNTYFIPIERLTREKELFARLQSLRYAFAAHFGEPGIAPFQAIWGAHNDIMTAASVLIQITFDHDDDSAFRGSAEPFLNTLGWGPAARPDEIERKIETAVRDIEALCRPVLSGKPIT